VRGLPNKGRENETGSAGKKTVRVCAHGRALKQKNKGKEEKIIDRLHTKPNPGFRSEEARVGGKKTPNEPVFGGTVGTIWRRGVKINASVNTGIPRVASGGKRKGNNERRGGKPGEVSRSCLP